MPHNPPTDPSDPSDPAQPSPQDGHDLPYIPATEADVARMNANLTAFQAARARLLRSLSPALRARLMRRWGLRPSDLDLPSPPTP